MQPRLRYDDVAWEKSEAIVDGWIRQFLEAEVLRTVGTFLVRHHRPGDAVEFSFLEKGAYNVCFQMKYKHANTAVIRFPQPGAAIFPEEKVRNEVATMRYIGDQTSIPRNDAIDSAEDCRRKLVARYLFCKLAREHRLTERLASFDKGPFKLWCDDFRPANILMNEELKIVGVVDWEFAYAAPVEFSFGPPWWLLIEKPEYWPRGLDD
ncbi:hypothetical protein Asppvi_008239 [Aspergillus pseudoviridinutans]|uniref:Aminoglycoside phosphotransferase domain-containing protein n=1 Tax=Aspergillus pseudoviridinutans TaxID=1517512 RepID=A0A9P3EX82_9EURO|nr:uncharacterized protein Asppvi_008239 [Aspergillus pseudoviridinutans]GIJ89302.1 hypothetical protein Asppvi_008239 [Aspergillus pseudoviridinutans]